MRRLWAPAGTLERSEPGRAVTPALARVEGGSARASLPLSETRLPPWGRELG